MLGGMGDDERCPSCGHLLTTHDPVVGCTDRVPGTKDRMPGACACGAKKVLADVIPFRSRAMREIEANGAD
jgi:hypothetical protein